MTAAAANDIADPGAGRACDLTSTRRVLRTYLLRAVLLTVVGVACSVGFVVGATVVSDRSDALRASGVSTPGTIVTLREDTGKQEGGADVRYVGGGVERTRPVDLGADADGYAEGQQVTVHYDRSDPDRMTIDDEDNQSTWSVYLMIAALLVGPTATVVGVWCFVRGCLMRLVLQRAAWEVQALTSTRLRCGRMRFTAADGTRWRSGPSTWAGSTDRSLTFVRETAGGPLRASAASGPLWQARRSRVAVVTRDPASGTPLVLTRRTRRGHVD